jgi:two-component system alkaline phosphatase synthesis response regulator PhoP
VKKADLHALLVDDNPQGIEPLEVRLKAIGYRTTIAQNGEAALARFNEDRPTIVVLDVTMPEMNGYQTCREMKRIDASVPVLILTGKTEPADRFWAFQSGADAFLNKPIDPATLVQEIAALLARS